MKSKGLDLNTIPPTTLEISLQVGDIFILHGDHCLVTLLESDRLSYFRGTKDEVEAKKREMGI